MMVAMVVVAVVVVEQRLAPGRWQTQRNWEPSETFLWMTLFPTVCCHRAAPRSVRSAHPQLHMQRHVCKRVFVRCLHLM